MLSVILLFSKHLEYFLVFVFVIIYDAKIITDSEIKLKYHVFFKKNHKPPEMNKKEDDHSRPLTE